MKLGLRRGTVALEPHSREWETAAQETIAKLKEILPGTLTDAQHVGSTAVRGLCAKPIIDLAVAVTDFDTLLTRNGELEKNGFHFRGQDHPGQYLYVCGDGDLVTHHVHAVLRDSEEWKDYVGLRDYLRTHPEDAQAYAALKETLAARFPEERSRYTAMKHDFIQTLLEKARTAKTGPGAGEGGMMETRFPYALIDLHCDTLTRWTRHRTGGPDTLDDPIHVLTLSTIPPEVHWAQLYAIFIPDELRGPDAIAYYEENRLSFHRQMEKFADRVASCVTPDEMEKIWAEGKTAAYLSVENASALAGDLSRVALLRQHGVRFMTLTWNGENELASGHVTDHGFSSFGREAVAEMEREGIVADISHLNDKGVEEFLSFARKPFVATHSNARAVCSHKRNLTDDMIREMVRRNCLIGLNYFTRFLEDDGNVPEPAAILRHVEHFFSLGAEKILALGSDFDGADLPEWLNTPRKAASLYGLFLEHGLSEEQASDIMYRNAERFFRENL